MSCVSQSLLQLQLQISSQTTITHFVLFLDISVSSSYYWTFFICIHIKNVFSRIHLTSILRLDGDDALPLRTKTLCGSSLNFKLVGNILSQVWDSQTGLSTVAVHLEGTHITWRKHKRKNTFSQQRPTSVWDLEYAQANYFSFLKIVFMCFYTRE